MKRSDAIKIITKEIQNWMSSNPDEFEANLILELVEHIGMLPPKYYINGKGEEPGDPSYHGLNGWEEE